MGYPVDSASGCKAAYGLRKLAAAYAGSCLRVRRASDGTEQDVGFSGDALDVSAMESFCASADGDVVRFYDQSGNGQTLARTSGASRIVTAGTMLTDAAGNPRVECTAAVFTATAAGAWSNQNLTAFIAQQLAAFDAWNYLLHLGGTPNYNYLRWEIEGEETNVRIGDGGSHVQTSNASSTSAGDWPTVQSLDLNGQAVTLYRERTQLYSAVHAKAAATSTAVGFGAYTGNLAEVVVYPHLSDGDRLAVYDAIREALGWDGPAGLNASALLPQSWAWHETIYDWLQSLVVGDVTITYGGLTWDGTYNSDLDLLGRLYLALGGDGRTKYSNGATANGALRAPAKWFVLDDGAGAGIEGAGAVKEWTGPAGGTQAPMLAYWYSLNLPKAAGAQGNPYYQHAPIGRRALALAAVTLLMHDRLQDQSPEYWSNVDFAGGAMLGCVWPYRVCKALLDAPTQAAFERGFAYHCWKFLRWGAHEINTNMDMKAVAFCANLYMATDDATYKSWALQAARKILFGSATGTPDTSTGVYRRAGYITEGGSPETTYNNASLNMLAEAYAVTRGEADWVFLETVVGSKADFKGWQYFREPDGLVHGPSGYAGRTGGSYVVEQQSSSWRNATAAFASDDARWLAANTPTAAAMVTAVTSTVASVNADGIGSADAGLTPNNWGGATEHWPIDNFYEPEAGWQAAMLTLIDAADESTLHPFRRTAHFSKNFDDQFWAYKNDDGVNDFGFFVEALTATGSYDGWYGGKLEQLWFKDFGTAILAKHDKSGDSAASLENTRVWSQVDTWAVPTVWGKDGSVAPKRFAFAAREGAQTSAINEATATPNAAVSVSIGDATGSGTGQEAAGAIAGTLTLETTIEALSDGASVAHALTYSGSDQITELWATIPLFLRSSSQSIADTSIQRWTGTAWQSLDTSIVAAEWLRLVRNFGSGDKYAFVHLPAASRVKLSSAVWQQSYQDTSRIRNVLVDLHGDPGSAQAVPTSQSFSYSVVSTDPGFTSMDPIVTFNYPEATDVYPAGGAFAVQASVDWSTSGTGTVYADYSTDGGTTYTELSAMTLVGANYEYAGGTVPAGLTHLRVRAIGANAAVGTAARAVTAGPTTLKAHDTFTAANDTAIIGRSPDTVNLSSLTWTNVDPGGSTSSLSPTVQSNRARTPSGSNASSTAMMFLYVNSLPIVAEAVVNRNAVATDTTRMGVYGRVHRYHNHVGAFFNGSGQFILQESDGFASTGSGAKTGVTSLNASTDYRTRLQIAGKVAVGQVYNAAGTLLETLALFGLTGDRLVGTVAGFQGGRTGMDTDEFKAWTFAADVTAPATPTGLAATAGVEEVSLDWDANGESDLGTYKVYRSPDNATFTHVATVTAPTSAYTDTGLVGSQIYYYKVGAVDLYHNESALTSSASATPSDPPDTTPPAPTSAVLAADGLSIAVTTDDATDTLGPGSITGLVGVDDLNITSVTGSGGAYTINLGQTYYNTSAITLNFGVGAFRDPALNDSAESLAYPVDVSGGPAEPGDVGIPSVCIPGLEMGIFDLESE